jgi:hypothetical protein
MEFAIGVTILECFFAKHSHGPLGVKIFQYSHCRGGRNKKMQHEFNMNANWLQILGLCNFCSHFEWS